MLRRITPSASLTGGPAGPAWPADRPLEGTSTPGRGDGARWATGEEVEGPTSADADSRHRGHHAIDSVSRAPQCVHAGATGTAVAGPFRPSPPVRHPALRERGRHPPP